MTAIYFSLKSDLRKWFEQNHEQEDELIAGYYKKSSGIESITWQESVDEALCFGWIDGIRRSVDDERYTIRFTPRRKGSIWSQVNINRMKELIKAGLVTPAGLKAFEARDEKKTRLYSFEQGELTLADEYEKLFRKKKKAWDFFLKLPESARRPSVWYVMSAKKEDTRKKRLDILISCSEEGTRIPQLVISKKKKV